MTAPNDRRYQAGIERLRLPERLARLEVDRVTDLCLDGLQVRSALDVGVGSGVFAEAFAARGLRVSGVDIDPAMLEAAGAFVPAGDFRLAPAEELPYEADAFDLVFLGLVAHETDDLGKALSEARRTARMRTAILEWPYREESFGPPLTHRLRPEAVEAAAHQAGFTHAEIVPLTQLVLYRLEA